MNVLFLKGGSFGIPEASFKNNLDTIITNNAVNKNIPIHSKSYLKYTIINPNNNIKPKLFAIRNLLDNQNGYI